MRSTKQIHTHLDLCVEGNLLAVVFFIIVRIHAQIVESKFLLYPVLERLPLLQGETVALCNDGDDVDNIAEFLQDNNVDWLERVAGGLNEEQAAVDAGVLNVSLALGGEFLVQVCAILVFDILDDGVPAAVVVHKIAVSRGVDNVEPETDAILLDDV